MEFKNLFALMTAYTRLHYLEFDERVTQSERVFESRATVPKTVRLLSGMI